MGLFVLDSKADHLLKITRVGRNHSTGVIVRLLDERRQEIYKDWNTGRLIPHPAISAGWRLSSSIYRTAF